MAVRGQQSRQIEDGDSMKSCLVYLYIDGKDFDPETFNKSLDSNLKGSIKIKKIAEIEFSGKYWVSKEIQVDPNGYSEDCLYDLLKSYKPSLLSLGALKTKRIFAKIITYYSDSTSLSGYSFSKELLGLLVEVGAEVDIDVYGPGEE